MPASSAAHVLVDQRGPDRRHRGGIVAGELGARPVGDLAQLGAHRLGEHRLAGAGGESLRNRRGSRALRAAQASGDRPSDQPCRCRPARSCRRSPRRRNARRPRRRAPARARSRPATSRRRSRPEDRAPRPARRRRRRSARRSAHGRLAGDSPWPRRSMVISRWSAASGAWPRKKPPCAMKPWSSTSGRPAPSSR